MGFCTCILPSSTKPKILLAQTTNCFQINLFKSTAIIIIIVVVSLFLSILFGTFGYIHYKMIKIVFIQNKHSSDKTIQMQRMLYASIFAQTIGLSATYLFPLLAGFIAVLTQYGYASSLFMLIIFCLSSYEICNYLVIFIFIHYFRNFLKKSILKIYRRLRGIFKPKPNNVILVVSVKNTANY